MTAKQEPDGTWISVPRPHPSTIRLAKHGGSGQQVRDNENGKTLGEMGFKTDDTLAIHRVANTTASKMPLLTPENKINARATAVFSQIFERYAIDDPDDPEKGRVITVEGMYKYVEDATGEKNGTASVEKIMACDSNMDGKISRKDFLFFY